MAEKKTSPKDEKTEKHDPTSSAPRPRRRIGSKIQTIVFMIAAGIAAPFVLPTLLLCLGLLPTLVVLITDTDRQKSSAATIGFMNVAGVMPFIVDLWQQGQTMEVALRILGQPNTWLIMLGAAGVGKLLLYAIPPAMALLTLTRMDVRLKGLKDGLEHIKSTWGPDVATSRSPDEIRRGGE